MTSQNTTGGGDNRPPKRKPWYKYGMVWLLIAFPLSAVISGVWILEEAIHSESGLVVDDYYKQGLAINQILDRDHAAARHELVSVVYFDYNQKKIDMQMRARPGYTLPARIQLKIMHPTREGFDHTVELVRGSDGIYHATLPKLVEARWYLQLEAGDWRLLGRLKTPQFSMVKIIGGSRQPNT